MRGRTTLALWVAMGLGLLALGALVGLLSPPPASDDVPGWLVAVVVLFVLVLSAVKLLRTPDDAETAPAPWTEEGAMVTTSPESTPDTDRISGTAFTESIESARQAARGSETIAEGLGAVREPLRGALVGALRQGGWDEARIDAALAEGSWTDDPVAAAVLDERAPTPERSLRRRVWAWLFPAKAVRHRSARAVGAVAAAADRVLPPVVGQRAPRPVPIVEPTLEDLQRAADGSLRRAVEGSASVRRASAFEGGADTDEEGVEADADESTAADETGTTAAENGEPDEADGSERRDSDTAGRQPTANDSAWEGGR